MPKYVLMTKLGEAVMQDPRGRKAVGDEWRKRVKKLCPAVKWIEHMALLGPYDFMTIYEAPSDEEAHKVSMLCRASGAKRAESWPAIAYERFLEITEPVEAMIHAEKS